MALSYIEACAILEVSPGASNAEIRDAYRLFVKVWHPDRFAHDDALRGQANAKMSRINEAHAIVKEGPSGAPFMGAHSDPDVYTSAEEPGWTWASEPEPDVPPGGFYSRHLSAEDVDGQDVGGTLGILALHYGMGVVAFGGVMVSEGAMSWQERNERKRLLNFLSAAHTEMFYDGNGINATALWMPDQVVDLAAGDIFKVGVRIESDDTGRGRIRISGVVFRNLCLNLIIIGQGEVETLSQVHRGSPRKILSKLNQGVQEARKSVGNFLEAWGHARTVKVKPKTLLKDWVEKRTLKLPGIRSAEDRDRVVQSLLNAWEKEPGDTLADTINAVTRAAHEEDWSVTFRREMERQASRLVYARR